MQNKENRNEKAENLIMLETINLFSNLEDAIPKETYTNLRSLFGKENHKREDFIKFATALFTLEKEVFEKYEQEYKKVKAKLLELKLID